MAKIKICGLKRLEDVEIVNKYKPDFVGFVFADSKRKVTLNLARQMKQNLDDSIQSVGVFVDAAIDEILEIHKRGIIDMAQLHGSESDEYIEELRQKSNCQLKIINAIEMDDEKDLLEYDNSTADYLLFDSGKGSGKTFDWRLIRKDLKKEFFLAGGLNYQNISCAINEFDPYAIDLSSSVETNGYKDELKIKKVMEAMND